MSALLRRLCTRIDDFHERRPVIAILIALAVAAVCAIGIETIGAVSPEISHIGGFA